MPWPTPQDYNEVVQNPRLAFGDPELASGYPELDQLGLPKVISGGFACVYKIICGNRPWAARCFQTEIADQKERYEAIDRHLSKARLPYMVSFGYQAAGIKVQGRSYPLLKMEWLKGEPLSTFIEKHLGNPSTIRALTDSWLEMLRTLQDCEIAHGDLQHGNVIVVGDKLRLLDYDAMYVPELAGRFSNEVGHRNYQHLARTNLDFGPHLDHFSGWVIYATLLAVSERPDLWRKHNGGDECLLFRRTDFEDPHGSSLFSDLACSTNSNLRIIGDFVAKLCESPLIDVPPIDVGHSGPISGSISPTSTTISRWWEDHIDEPVEITPEPEIKVDEEPNVEWILDEALDSTIAREITQFHGPGKGIRALVAISILAVTFAICSPGMSPIVRLVACIGTVGVVLLVAFVRYRDDSSLSEYAEFRKSFDKIATRVAEARQERSSIADLLSGAIAEMNSRQAEWRKFRQQLRAEMHEETESLGLRVRESLRVVQAKRGTLSDREASEARSLQADLSNKVGALDRSISSLAEKEKDEKERRLKLARTTYITDLMQRFSIANGHIPGIGPTFAARLASRGYRTAADLERGGFISIPGIGSVKADALKSWRDRIRVTAEATAPTSLSLSDARQISDFYAAERSTLVKEKHVIESQVRSRLTELQSKCAKERKAIDAEESGVRTTLKSAETAIVRRYQAQLAELENSAKAQKSNDFIAIDELKSKLASFDKEFSILLWEWRKKRREGERYKKLTFLNYLKKLVGLKTRI